MLNRIFTPVFIIMIISIGLSGCLSSSETVQAPTITPYEGPYVIVEPQIGYPEAILNESGFGFPANETVTINFKDPNGQIHSVEQITNASGDFPYEYIIRQNELSGWWIYYANYRIGGSLMQTPGVGFWITNPEISVTPDENNHNVKLNGTGFSPSLDNKVSKVQVRVDYLGIDWALQGGENIIKTEIHDGILVDEEGKFHNCCEANQGLPIAGNAIGGVRFSVIDLTTGYPSNSENKIEITHPFNDALLGLEVPTIVNTQQIVTPTAIAQQEYQSSIPVSVEYNAPKLTLVNLSGKPESLEDYRGQVVLVNLWATWCPPCKDELPVLQAYYEDHQLEGFVVIGIDSQEKYESVDAYIKTTNVNYPIWIDTEGVAGKAFSSYSLPTSFVIDRNGVVRFAWTGAISQPMLEQYITPLIRE